LMLASVALSLSDVTAERLLRMFLLSESTDRCRDAFVRDGAEADQSTCLSHGHRAPRAAFARRRRNARRTGRLAHWAPSRASPEHVAPSRRMATFTVASNESSAGPSDGRLPATTPSLGLRVSLVVILTQPAKGRVSTLRRWTHRPKGPRNPISG
jgi:hypothetical protein